MLVRAIALVVALVALVALPCTSATMTALNADAAGSLKVNPLYKIERMLQDMQEEIEKDFEEENKNNEELKCWCKQAATKEAEIDAGKKRVGRLASAISKNQAVVAQTKIKLGATEKEYRKDRDALYEAQDLRAKEHKQFNKAENDLVGGIQAVKNAKDIISKGSSSFTEVRTVSHRLLNTQADWALSNRDTRTLRTFLIQAAKAPSFLEIQTPAADQIAGIIDTLRKNMEDQLKEEREAEKVGVKEFGALSTAKKSEMETAKKLMTKVKGESADAHQRYEDDAKEKKDIEAMVDATSNSLAQMKKSCSTRAREFELTVKSYQEEMQAVSDTLAIIRGDELGGNATNATNTTDAETPEAAEAESEPPADSFLQLRAAASQEARRQRVIVALQQAAGKLRWPHMIMLAMSSRIDGFKKVRSTIDALVQELKLQQKEDAERRDWCKEAVHENEMESEAAHEEGEKHTTKIADLESTIDTVDTEMKGAKEAMEKMTKEQAKAADIREKEAAAYKTVVADHQIMSEILKKALERMKQVYSFVEADAAEKTGAPTRKKNAGGSKVLALLEDILKDMKRDLVKAAADEQQAQGAYDEFTRETKVTMKQTRALYVELQMKKAEAKEEHTRESDDLAAIVKRTEDLGKTSGTIHKSCDFLLKNFDVRRTARAGEISALREAAAVLTGGQ